MTKSKPLGSKIIKDVLHRKGPIYVKIIDPTPDEPMEQIVHLFECWHKESAYSDSLVFSPNRIRNVVRDLQANASNALMLAMFDGAHLTSLQGQPLYMFDRLIGVMAGRIGPLHFSDAIAAHIEHWYIHPSYRSTSAAVRSLMAFRMWAVKNKASVCMIPTATGARIEQTDMLLKKLDYRLIGGTYLCKL